MAGDVVFDCSYCQGPLELVLPLAVQLPHRGMGQYRVAKRKKHRCEEWLRSQHPGQSLSQVMEAMGMDFNEKWAFEGYNWGDGDIHIHGQDVAP
jgi:hypothetical protein